MQVGPEWDLLATWYDAAVAAEPSLGPPVGAMGAGRVAAQLMVDRLLRSRTFAGMTQRLFVGNLRQVTSFLGDPEVKDRVLGRVAAEVGGDTAGVDRSLVGLGGGV